MTTLYALEPLMRTTLNIDDELFQQARELSGLQEKTALIREGLKALIERESAKRLAKLGGSEPQLEPIPRRQGKLRIIIRNSRPY
jgi:Arc/MetJ family transcription regulator